MNLKTHISENLWLDIATSYEAENYRHAIVDAMHHLTAVIREKSGLDGDGDSLVSRAFGGKSPRVKVTKLQTETERNEQNGIALILRGLYRAVRNPRSHEQMEDSKDSADAIIYFINYLLGIIAESAESFTIPKFLQKVFDPDFVGSDRYAELLVAEVPSKKRLDTLIQIFRGKTHGDGEKLKFMVKAIMSRLSFDDVEEFLQVVSEELANTRDDTSVRVTLQILPKDFWPRIGESARLRVENKLIESVKTGRYNVYQHQIMDGGLGTWANGLAPHFTLKTELIRALLHRLQADDESGYWYILEYFGWDSYRLCLSKYQVATLIDAISGKVYGFDALDKEVFASYFKDFESEWRSAILSRIADLAQEDPEFYKKLETAGEIPF